MAASLEEDENCGKHNMSNGFINSDLNFLERLLAEVIMEDQLFEKEMEKLCASWEFSVSTKKIILMIQAILVFSYQPWRLGIGFEER